MNSHYNPYTDISSSPHPPSPDNNNYAQAMSIGNNSIHHNGHVPIINPLGGQPGFHQINNNNSMMNKCGGCGGKIAERYLLSALDKFWHHTCLKCTSCHATLADLGTSFFTKGSMILCKEDYLKMFSPTPCAACNQIISPNELVMRTAAQANQQAPNQPNQLHVFHLKCFTCSSCNAQLRPGDRYYVLNGKLVCEQDWHKLVKSPITATGTTVRKGKVGRPRRSRD